MIAGKRTLMVLVDRFDADTLLAQLKNVSGPTRSRGVDRRAAFRSGTHKGLQRPADAALNNDDGGWFGTVLNREGLCRPLPLLVHILALSLAGKGTMRYVCGILLPSNECAAALCLGWRFRYAAAALGRLFNHSMMTVSGHATAREPNFTGAGNFPSAICA